MVWAGWQHVRERPLPWVVLGGWHDATGELWQSPKRSWRLCAWDSLLPTQASDLKTYWRPTQWLYTCQAAADWDFNSVLFWTSLLSFSKSWKNRTWYSELLWSPGSPRWRWTLQTHFRPSLVRRKADILLAPCPPSTWGRKQKGVFIAWHQYVQQNLEHSLRLAKTLPEHRIKASVVISIGINSRIPRAPTTFTSWADVLEKCWLSG